MTKEFTPAIEDTVCRKIVSSFSGKKTEQGGIIGCSAEGVINRFYYDENPSFSDARCYCPNGKTLSYVINEMWAKEGIRFAGLVHSHLYNDQISPQDVDYAKEILKANPDLEELLIGVVDVSQKIKTIKWFQITL